MDLKLVFGPVPSRRLGKSVGINNIPPKICTYSCIYCQLGKSCPVAPEPRTFYDPEQVLAQTRDKLDRARASGEAIDYLTIVSDGEPTLDKNLGRLIRRLSSLGFKIAVITNASLLSLPKVRENLGCADWVSLKVDALDEGIWRKIDRPYHGLDFDGMLEGMIRFARDFTGILVTETMLVRGKNHGDGCLEKTARFIYRLSPSIAYLGIPTRPPAVPQVAPPDEAAIHRAWQVFRSQGIETEYLIGYEGNQFAYTGDIEADILSITAVHPMRHDAVSAYLEKAGAGFCAIEKLVRENRLRVCEYKDETFYIRTLKS